MTYSIDNYIGQEVKRIIFSIKRTDKKYYFLFGIIEKMVPGSDVDLIRPERNPLVDCDRGSDGDKDKVYVSVDYVELTEAMTIVPWRDVYVGKTPILNDVDSYKWEFENWYVIPSVRRDKTELHSLMPLCRSSLFCNVCKPEEKLDAVNTLLNSEVLKEQLTALSLKHLGYDLCPHTIFLGSWLLINYNPIYKSIDVTENSKEDGIYIRINYRQGRHDKLKLTVIGKDRSNNIINTENFELDGRFFYKLTFREKYAILDFIFFDEDGTTIDYHQDMVFIHSILVDIGIKEKDVVLKSTDGSERRVEKFSHDKPMVIGEEIADKSIWDTSPEISYARMERSLDFVFFDGDKDNRKTNQSKARECVERILNQARSVCYICDIYFNADTLFNFVAPIKQQDVEVRVITSKENLSPEKREELKEGAKKLRDDNVANVYCRMLKGKASLHDRFIVADDKVWMLGCSLNEFGVRATTLIRIPGQYCQKLICWAEQQWNDNEMTEAL